MKNRCDNPNDQQYRLYGGRGIHYCVGWHVFEGFLEWAKNSGYRPGLFLDRCKNHLGYYPENCRWLTPQLSGVNRRTTKLSWDKVEEIRKRVKDGEMQKDLADEFKVARNTISSIVTEVKWKKP